MSSRPKRKATINRTYNDNDELDFEKMITPESANAIQKLDRLTGKKIKKPAVKQYNNISTAPSTTASANSVEVTEYVSEIPMNWQPPLVQDDYFSSHLDLENAHIKDNTLICQDGVTVSKGECIYMISEPPGEPYYIGRILGFDKKDKQSTTTKAENYLFKITWLYRPRDISKHATDSRLLFASMHTDSCPLLSYRGKAIVKHRSDIDDLETYRESPNCFWFDKLFDRYMIKFYDVLVTDKLTNLPDNYYKALNKRFEFIFVENGKSKDFLSDLKNCEKCSQWCSSVDSVSCVNCQKYYHMLCLSPPLLKKPSRGFGWSCASCNKAAEDKMIEKKGELLNNNGKRGSSQELDSDNMDIDSNSEESGSLSESSTPKYEELAIIFLKKDSKYTLLERRNIEEWPYRYLGMHAKLEDALDLEDRPYPRAASRLGSKHQAANIPFWYNHPVVYYDKEDGGNSSSKKKQRGGNYKKRVSADGEQDNDKILKLEIPEEYRDTDVRDFPPWLAPRPKGYIERGEDEGEFTTSTLLWRPPTDDDDFKKLDEYIKECEPFAKKLDTLPNTPNFYDAILKAYMDCGYDGAKAINIVSTFTRDSLAEPTFTQQEVEKFEDAVRKYGSELYPVFQEVGTQKCSMIVRFYYLWKKTTNGHLIWDNFEGRKKKKVQETTQKKDVKTTVSVDTIANSDDDSSYDMEKGIKQNRSFVCKHCQTDVSVQWYRISGHNAAPKDADSPVIAICIRCAKLWRRYAVIWEEPNDVLKKLQQRGGNGWKRKVESELVKDSEAILEEVDRVKNGGIPMVAGVSSSNGLKKITKIKSPMKRKSQSPPPTIDATKRIKANIIPTFKAIVSNVKEEKEHIAVAASVMNGKKKSSASSAKNSSSKSKQNGTVGKDNASKKELDGKQALKSEKMVESEPISIGDALYPGEPRENPNYQESSLSEDSVLSESLLNNLRNQKQFSNSFSLKATNLPLYDPSSRPCCVCRESDNVDEVVICSNCGLNVHASCYGVVRASPIMYDKRWACDSCSNDLHPIISTFYSCTLCYAREIDHDSAITGNLKAVPDALKRTLNGHWCHILCAIFSEEITFGNVATLQPCLNISSAILANEGSHCHTCGGKGGTLVKCKLCDDRVHVSCAQDSPNYFIGFEMQATFEREKSVKVANISGKPVPTIICSKHDLRAIGERFVPLRTAAKRSKNPTQFPLIQIYCEDFKKDQTKLSGVQLVADEYRMLTEASKYRSKQISVQQEATPKAEIINYKCLSCESSKSPKWWDSPNSPTGKLCHTCYIKQTKPEIIGEDAIYDTINQENNLLKWVNQPLDGSNYGLLNPNDTIDIDQHDSSKKFVSASNTARISIGDILS